MAPVVAALPVLIPLAISAISTGASIARGQAEREQQEKAQRAELVENILTARENIASLREKRGLVTSQSEQQLTEHRRREQIELGEQRGAFAGSGVKVGQGGSVAAIRAGTQALRGTEREAMEEATGFELGQIASQIGTLGRREEDYESALRTLRRGGILGRKRRKREFKKFFKKKDFEFTEGF